MKIKVSVIVPVYNVEKYLAECIRSIINQTFKEIEIIFIDDGSTDNSGLILERFATEDDRIHVIHKQNEGVSIARNVGLLYSKGEYIYIMDSDDYLEHNALEIMYNNALKTNAEVVITDHYTFKDDYIQNENHFFYKEFVTKDKTIIQQIQNMVLYPAYSPYRTNENRGLGIGAPATKLIKRELILDNLLSFDPYVKGIFDDGLFAIFIFQYAKKVSYIRQLTLHYRILPTSLSHRFNSKRIEIDRRVFQRIEDFIDKYDKDEQFIEAFYARIISYMVNSYRIYYFNKGYKGSIRKNYKEFEMMMKSEPYKTAIKKVDTTKLSSTQKIITFLARFKLFFCVWLAYKIKYK